MPEGKRVVEDYRFVVEVQALAQFNCFPDRVAWAHDQGPNGTVRQGGRPVQVRGMHGIGYGMKTVAQVRAR